MDELKRHSDAIAEACRKYGVRKLEVFGSFARGDARPDSDVDLLVDFAPPYFPGFFNRYMGLLETLEEVLGRPIDLVEIDSIKNPYFDAEVNAVRRVVYAA